MPVSHFVITYVFTKIFLGLVDADSDGLLVVLNCRGMRLGCVYLFRNACILYLLFKKRRYMYTHINIQVSHSPASLTRLTLHYYISPFRVKTNRQCINLYIG